MLFFSWSGQPPDLHVLTHSFPTRRSSDLRRATIARVTAWARDRDIRLGRELAGGDPAALCATIDTLVASGLLTRFEAGSETIYSIDPAKHPMASYYRNIVAHHFLDRAMIEMALFDLRDVESRGIGRAHV